MHKFLWIKFLCHVEYRRIHQANINNNQKFEKRSKNVRIVKLHKQVAPGQAPNCYRRKGESKMPTTATSGEPGDIRGKQEHVIY